MNESISLQFFPFSDRKDITSTLGVQIFEYEVCNHESKTKAAFYGHKSLQHNPSIHMHQSWKRTNFISATLP